MLLDMLDEAAEKGSLTFKGSKDRDGNYFFHDSYEKVFLPNFVETLSINDPVKELATLEKRLQSVMDDCMEFSQNNEKFLEDLDEFKDFNTTVIAGLDEAIDSVRFCIENGKNILKKEGSKGKDVVKEAKEAALGGSGKKISEKEALR